MDASASIIFRIPFFGCLAIAYGTNRTIFGDQDMEQQTCSKSSKLEIGPRNTRVKEEVVLLFGDQ